MRAVEWPAASRRRISISRGGERISGAGGRRLRRSCGGRFRGQSRGGPFFGPAARQHVNHVPAFVGLGGDQHGVHAQVGARPAGRTHAESEAMGHGLPAVHVTQRAARVAVRLAAERQLIEDLMTESADDRSRAEAEQSFTGRVPVHDALTVVDDEQAVDAVLQQLRKRECHVVPSLLGGACPAWGGARFLRNRSACKAFPCSCSWIASRTET